MLNKVFSIILMAVGAITIITNIVFIILGNMFAMFVTSGIAIAIIFIIISIYSYIENCKTKTNNVKNTNNMQNV